ncbi:DUF3592 domain-containing protein [Corynebacterium sp. CCUG 65737]|uniref:DUF3592 domain-containing protein n=1 Tax=unclassified Corynebacterium TaxID=2624378 RepID=UPI00210A5FA8|nr:MULTISPECIES: DUF3592 domain-containing protein [unclassified Corynebacterium]MCQ4621815.1 DUF3592 domain-containing protein [Corynebacterium sp. CCUG 70398]MCQ4625133.1 DUF3592 domain-containing protein [Corynebacterium sp. CCUG 69979]MCQ4627699.1 DUF3592 domain-containing protein [Corynebacterium sp. CCUG 65737]
MDYILLIMAAVVIFKGISDYMSLERLASHGVRVEGRVVDSFMHEKRTQDRGNRTRVERTMVETIEFTTVDGQPLLGQPAHSDVGMNNRIGQIVTVIYDPNYPQHFTAPVHGNDVNVVLPVTTMLIGGLMLLVGLIAAF